MPLGRTAKYYRENPKARKKKQRYDAALNKRPEQVKKRVELNKYNRKNKGKRGAIKGDGLDAVHKKNIIVGYKRQSANRADTNDTVGDRNARGKKKR